MKVSINLENIFIIINEVALELRTLTVLLVGYLMEKGNTLWTLEEKRSSYKVAENWTELCFSIEWKIELESEGYLAEIMKQHVVEGIALFLLAAYSKT